MQSNSSNNNNNQPQTSHTSTSRSSDSGEACGAGNKWASKLLSECARAISEKDSSKIHNLLWMLNELASPYGDCDQKLASHFLQALFCKATDSGQRCFKTLTTVAEKSHSFDSARKLILKFQEWPTLLEALATRNDETPHLKLTVVVTASIVRSVMKEIGQRMEKFARLMGVPFELNVISGLNHLGELTKEELGVQEDEAVAINCNGALRRVGAEERNSVIRMFQSLNPRVVTIVEEEADFTSSRYDFVKCFEECLRNIVRVLACDEENDGGECERRERGSQWFERLREAFSPVGFSDDVVDDVKALLKRYRGAHLYIINLESSLEMTFSMMHD
ncbi:hypothetical protein D5086_014272 [Populus alba]|uniref:Uncharacterized protein n=1 Tax=Populus alba TaxID=43335 RepID=A0ACC4BXR8_POPAL